jgi:hypothetical protein
MLRFAIPEYRLPKSVLRRELDLIERVGVKMVFNTRVGIRPSAQRSCKGQFDAVFLSIGTWKESWLYLPGTELKGVYPALPFLESVAKHEKRQARLAGCRSSAAAMRPSIRREQCCAWGPAPPFSIAANARICLRSMKRYRRPKKEGVRSSYLAAPHRILGGRRRKREGHRDSSRRGLVNTTNRGADGPFPLMKCSASNATA